MATRNRHNPSSSSSAEKRSSISDNSSNKKVTAVKTHLTKKRPPLADITSQRNASVAGARTSAAALLKPLVPCMSKTVKTKKEPVTSSQKNDISGDIVKAPVAVKSSNLVSSKGTGLNRTSKPKAGIGAFLAQSSVGAVYPASTSGSVSLDESMSTCDSLNSPEFEYIDNEDIGSVKSIERKTNSILNITGNSKIEGRICESDGITKIEATEVVDIDDDVKDPQFCASIAQEIYEYLRVSEERKRPSMEFMAKVQKDINASMRAILIDWLVEVAEEYRLLPNTLFLTANYIDRYLSGNVMNRQQLQLLGVACMMIAAKYEEICAPKVEEFCYITDNTYSREQVLRMESDVLNFLEFELTAPTARCFLRRFVIVAQRTCEVPMLHLEYLADYLTELSLLEYSMLRYAPSLVAASATFLAKFILLPRQKPWNSTLRHYTSYQGSDLCDCVKELHWLCCHGSYNLPAIREKYSQHKFKFVAKKHCPASIPPKLFQD